MENGTELTMGAWIAPECPFRIEYSTRVLDDIRLAVMDAFFSLPRGGAEIGGILLGKYEQDVVSITEFEPLDCEHATGPSFTLSPRDQKLLGEMTAKAFRNPRNRQPLGWYHSHTRTDIFLSENDQDLHRRYFPHPWQIALVLKPHTFEPMRAGFFFRESNGAIHSAASYQEFLLEALPVKRTPVNGDTPPATRRPLREDSSSRAPSAPASTEPASAGEPLVGAAAPPKEKKEVPITREIPAVEPLDETRAWDAGSLASFPQPWLPQTGRPLKAVAWLALGLAAGALGYQTRDFWLPKIRPVLPKESDSSLALSLSDNDGQLNIRWDRNSPAVRNASGATLEISDGGPVPLSIHLDGTYLATGIFSYARETDRVDVSLTAAELNGQKVKDQTSFFGKLPAQRAHGDDPGARKERDALAQKADKLQKDYDAQAARTRKLEKDLKEVRTQLEIEQRRRLAAQSADPAKKE